MEILERIWELIGTIFTGISGKIERSITSLFGSSNARYVKKLQPRVDAINALEPKYQAMTDAELKAQTDEFRQRLSKGETLDDILPDAFAVCREASRRFLGMRHFDVQLIGGMVLHSGSIAEMMTGEGKTLVATLPAYLNAIDGKGVHVVTVNDYLARRDMEWMGPLYMNLGLTVGTIQGGMESAERQKSYACNITYGTNNEFGFDYLRDNMRVAARDDHHYPKMHQQSQGKLNFAIIDEVDNILIDEARTPLIISGQAHDDVTRYAHADRIARQLKKDQHFEVKEKEHSCSMTEDGVRLAEQLAGVESFYTAGNMEWPHLIDNSLKAHFLYRRDVNYVVQEDEVVIVDEFTGRLMPGRNWSDGLHQAVEAKEGVKIKEENQTLATITLQNFFKLYKKICGMTGTAMTEATEFWKIYKLDVIAIPTNRDTKRQNFADVIFCSEREKYNAIADEVELIHKFDVLDMKDRSQKVGSITKEEGETIEFQPRDSKQKEPILKDKIETINRRGRPILVGTVSIEKSERISALLERRGIKHQVLNAKHHRREAEIVAQAGRFSAVTIATNMAGRGTDIILGGNPDAMAWAILQEKYATRLDVPQEEWTALVQQIEQREKMKAEGDKVRTLGGLHIIGSERHDARRIDLQLRGRCGRQGDPGSSRFYLSLEDDLMRKFAGEWVRNILQRLGMKDGEAIESRMVSRRIEAAQKKVEEQHFDSRKNLLEYDEVMDEQRKRVYGYRQSILDGVNCRELILTMIEEQVEQNVDVFLDRNYGSETFAKWASGQLFTEFEAKNFKGLDNKAAVQFARDEAERLAESQAREAIEENLPSDEEESFWNWEALAKWANTRWRLSLRDRDLKKVGRDGVAELIVQQAQESIAKLDLSEGDRFLDEDFGLRSACGWVHYKFNLVLNPEEVRGLDLPAFKKLVRSKAEAAYEEREVEYPVQAGMAHFTTRDNQGNKRYDRDSLVTWAKERFHVDLDVEDLKNKQREEVQVVLVEHSRTNQASTNALIAEIQNRVNELFDRDASPDQLAKAVVPREKLEALAAWGKEKFESAWTADQLGTCDHAHLELRLRNEAEDHFRPEIRRMERALVLQILDMAWKEHLLTMDHLKSSVGLRGYAQVDPKVEYKREGMRTFELMWSAIGDRVTDLFFRMEQLDEDFVGSTWKESAAIHEQAPSLSDMSEMQQAANSSAASDKKIEPIRNHEERTGRNDPCPCGSGKKYKQCCMRKRVGP